MRKLIFNDSVVTWAIIRFRYTCIGVFLRHHVTCMSIVLYINVCCQYGNAHIKFLYKGGWRRGITGTFRMHFTCIYDLIFLPESLISWNMIWQNIKTNLKFCFSISATLYNIVAEILLQKIDQFKNNCSAL